MWLVYPSVNMTLGRIRKISSGIPQPQGFEVRTSDGILLRGYRYGSASSKAVVFAHGFNTHQRVRKIVSAARRLAGLADVYTFDFRGHGISEGSCLLGSVETEDLEAVVRVAAVEHDRVVSVGASMGGGVVLRHAALRGGVDGVVSISAPSGLNGPTRRRAKLVSLLVSTSYGRSILRRCGTRVDMTGPEPDAAGAVAADISPIPVVVIHGDRDPYIAPHEATEIYEALLEPKRLITLPWYGHAEAGFDPAFMTVLEDVVAELLASGLRSETA